MKKLSVLAVCLCVLAGASAKSFKPVFLKGEKQINIVFDYSQVVFDGDSQEKFYNEKGTEWLKEWEGVRRDENADAFIAELNSELGKLDVKVGKYLNAQYTMIVEVLDCDFGVAGVFNAACKCTIKIVKTGTTEVLASTTLKETQKPYIRWDKEMRVDFARIRYAIKEVGGEVGEMLYKALK